MAVYEYNLRIGISHIGKDGLLKLGTVMDLLQNATWFQINEESVFMDYFEKNQVGMYLISRQIVIDRLPVYGEDITVKSWVVGCDKLFGYRNTAIYDHNGAFCVRTYAIGAYIDLTKAVPARMPQEQLDTVVTHESLVMPPFSRKIAIPPDMQTVGERIRVQSYHLDNYGHTNNARYVDIASAYIPDDFVVRYIRVEYKRAALPGDMIIPSIHQKDGYITITLNAEDGGIFTVMEFSSCIPSP